MWENLVSGRFRSKTKRETDREVQRLSEWKRNRGVRKSIRERNRDEPQEDRN